jgi:hypothetical protein
MCGLLYDAQICSGINEAKCDCSGTGTEKMTHRNLTSLSTAHCDYQLLKNMIQKLEQLSDCQLLKKEHDPKSLAAKRPPASQGA